jgi:ribosomal protein L11 methyltransferase
VTAPWWRVGIRCQPADRDAVAALLVGVTGQGVEEAADGTITTVASTAEHAHELLARVTDSFAGVDGEIARLDPVDWSVHWRDGIVTRRLGRLVLTPTWLPVAAGPGEVVLTLDPESAFGSGEHGSTRAALVLLERQLRQGDRMLDLGSGSGILAIAAALLGARSAIGIEVEEEALPIAEANAERNRVADRVTFLVGDAADLAAIVAPAELVCSNILRTVNTILLPTIHASLVPNGIAIFSGMEVVEESLFLPVLDTAGFVPCDDVRDGAWWGVAARRR